MNSMFKMEKNYLITWLNIFNRASKGSGDVVGDPKALNVDSLLLLLLEANAYLADGSEYSGIYGDAVTLETLKHFHKRRVQVLADSGADLIAFETIPNKLEAMDYAEILEEGDPISDCAAIADLCD